MLRRGRADMAATPKKPRPKMSFVPPSAPSQPVGAPEAPPVPLPVRGDEGKAAPRQNSRIGKRAVTFYVSQDAFRQLGVLSAQTDRTIQDMMLEAVDGIFQ